MVYISNKINSLIEKNGTNPILKEAESEMLMGQCNCAYWHGIFGGLYLYHLRNAIYYHLIKAEKLIDTFLNADSNFLNTDLIDADADGCEEVLISNKNLSIWCIPSDGGVLREISSKNIFQNFVNSLARRKEAYHRKILKMEVVSKNREGEADEAKTIHDGIQSVNEDVKKHLQYDLYDRSCLVDHFFSTDTNIKNFSSCDYEEWGDFVKGAYSCDLKKEKERVVIVLKRDGVICGNSFSVRKTISINKIESKIDVEYKIVNTGEGERDFVFAPEFNFTMPKANSDEYKIVFDSSDKICINDCSEMKNASRVSFSEKSEKDIITISLNEKTNIWSFPVSTVSQSEKAYELNYQSSSIVPLFRVFLKPGEEKTVEFSLELGE